MAIISFPAWTHRTTRALPRAASRNMIRLVATLSLATGAILLSGARPEAQQLRPCPFDIDTAIVLHNRAMDDLVNSRFIHDEEDARKREIKRKLDSQLKAEAEAFARAGRSGSRSFAEDVDAVSQGGTRDFRDLARAYLAPGQNGEAEGSNAVIAYVPDGETVCGIYAEYRPGWSEPRAFMFELPLPSGELVRLVDARMGELTLSTTRLDRSPVLRSEETAQTEPEDFEGVTRAATPKRAHSAATRPPALILADLSAALFPAPVFHHIEHEISNLTVVPALNIGTVPFAALDLDGDGQPLIATTTLNVEAALHSILGGDIYGWDGIVRHALVMGDPDATADLEWRLPRLPGALKEAEAVAALFRSQPIVARYATVARLLGEISGADYIHIAAHGIADPADPIDGSFLALSGGRLTAREIQSLDLRAMLPVVVLSACQSALGGTLEAGIIGVARGFLYAGAINVVASLWNVDDAATFEIMLRFAEELKTSSPQNALRVAQLEARDKWPDPRIWAAFTVYGARVVDAP
ncbi:CHAT domain-containing protein [Oricola sp.]|uniref:CHAT domain-containing protein n=1 Tax=Oricola sp. TaxID=1979950 RepID=UPI0025E02E54|nr:CHAT domain-containing protein [Oricola sp.]MCI5074631.1 CHAT domain-containing protein [Oricola sp.]